MREGAAISMMRIEAVPYELTDTPLSKDELSICVRAEP